MYKISFFDCGVAKEVLVDENGYEDFLLDMPDGYVIWKVDYIK